MSVFILSLFYFIRLIVEIEYIWFVVIFCIGNVGNVLDGYNFLIKSIFFSDDSDFDEETVDDVFFWMKWRLKRLSGRVLFLFYGYL